MRLLIITDAYPPELRSASGLMADLAEGLAERGHSVTVATTMPGYNLAKEVKRENIPTYENMKGVEVYRVPTLPHHHVPNVFRGINQMLLPLTFVREARKKIKRSFDYVIVHSPPLPLALSASILARLYRGKFIANIHDIFPQNAIDLISTWEKPLAWLAFRWMEALVYRRADYVVVPSENHIQYLHKKRGVSKEKMSAIPHWVSIPHVRTKGERFREKWGLNKDFIFFFGGVFGPSQSLDLVLDAAKEFTHNTNIKFLFVGGGTDQKRLEKIIKENNLRNVLIKPFISSEDYLEFLSEVDVGVVTLTSKNTTPAVPAKLMSYMVCGVPVVVAVHKESDAIRIVEDAECGFTALSSNREDVVSAFKRAYEAKTSLKTLGNNGREYAERFFNKNHCIEMWEEVLKKAIR